jgi:hypothetical protein
MVLLFAVNEEHPDCAVHRYTHIPLYAALYRRKNDVIVRGEWPRAVMRGSAAARLLGSRVLIPPEACMSFSCDCCLLSGRLCCVGPVTSPLLSVACLSVIVKPR